MASDPNPAEWRTSSVLAANDAATTQRRPPELEIGQSVADKYQVVRELGRGGMGVVYEARHLDLDCRVAIKVVLAQFAGSEEVTQRLVGEARAAARVRSEHAVQILDVGVLPSGLPFMVMEYVEGRSLQAELDECAKLPLSVVIDLVGQACLGLAEAHARQIVHRDVKPDNLQLSVRPDGSTVVKVVDFGLSKRLDSRDLKLTDPTLTLGSPEYMSPEQIVASDSIDARADVWSLGVVLYESVTGQSPFPAKTVMQLFSRVLEHDPCPPSAIEPGLPAEFDAVVLGCLQRDRERRFASAAEVFDALMKVPVVPATPDIGSRELGSSLVRRRHAASNSARVVNGAVSVVEETKVRSRTLWGALGAVVLASVLTLVFRSTPAPSDFAPAGNPELPRPLAPMASNVPVESTASVEPNATAADAPSVAVEHRARAPMVPEVAPKRQEQSAPRGSTHQPKAIQSVETQSSATMRPSRVDSKPADVRGRAWDIEHFGGRH